MGSSDLTERKTSNLVEEGHRLLRDGDTEGALKVAAELEALRFTAAFEIAALAHAQMGDLVAAATTLRRGLDIAPTVWINWQLLGNYLSDLERYDEAASAFDRALECVGAYESSLRLNQAILAIRRGMNEQALAYAAQVTDPDLAVRTAAVRVKALSVAGRFEDAIRTGEAAQGKSDAGESEELAFLAASVGRARMSQGASAEETFAFVSVALEKYDHSNPELLALIRDADHKYSATAKYYRMTIDAKIPFSSPLFQHGAGYIVNYDVVADSLEQALSFVERMEAPEVRGNLLVDDHEVLDEQSGHPMGVYKRSVRHYYEREE